jgi:hypothetical protein
METRARRRFEGRMTPLPVSSQARNRARYTLRTPYSPRGSREARRRVPVNGHLTEF